MEILGRKINERRRKIISLVLAVTFIFTMTGMDTILAHAFDPNRHENYQQDHPDDLRAPANPLETQPRAFDDLAQRPPADDQQVRDTRLNVLKSEYGDILTTVSLKTVAEQTTGGMSLETAVNIALENQPVQPTDGQEPAGPENGEPTEPAADPTLLAEAATTGQGPLTLTLDLGNMPDITRLGDEIGPDEVAKVPQPTVKPETEEPEPPEITPEGEQVVAAGTQPAPGPETEEPDVTIMPPETQPKVADITEVKPEVATVPDDTTPPEQEAPEPTDTPEDDKTPVESMVEDVAKQFMALLGMGEDKDKNETSSPEELETLKKVAETQEGQEEGDGVEVEEEPDQTSMVPEDLEPVDDDGEPTDPEEDDDSETLPDDTNPEDFADGTETDDDSEGETPGEETNLPEQVLVLLGIEDQDEGDPDLDPETLAELLVDVMPDGEIPELEEEPGETTEEDVDVKALLEKIGVEVDDNSLPEDISERSPVLADDDADNEEETEEPTEAESEEETILIVNTVTDIDEETDIAMVGPESVLEDNMIAPEEEEEGEGEDQTQPDPRVIVDPQDLLGDDDLEGLPQEALLVLEGLKLSGGSGASEAGYMAKLGEALQNGIKLITSGEQNPLNGNGTMPGGEIAPESLGLPEEIGTIPMTLPENVDTNLPFDLEDFKETIKEGTREELTRIKFVTFIATTGLLDETVTLPEPPSEDVDPEMQEWSGENALGGVDPLSVSTMFDHPHPPEQEQPDPKYTDYLTFGIVVAIFQFFVELKNFIENPSWETFGEWMFATFNPVGHLIYELANFSWDEMADYGEFAQSPIGKIIMFIITIILTIVTFGTAAPILIAIIILIELIQMFVPLPKWLDITLSIVKAALGGWASSLKEIVKEAVKVGMEIVFETLTQLMESLTKDVIKDILKAVIKEGLMQLMAELLPEDFDMFYRAGLDLCADLLASGLAELFVEGTFDAFLEGVGEAMADLLGAGGEGWAAIGVIEVLTSPLVQTALALGIQYYALKWSGEHQAQGHLAGAIYGAMAKGFLGYVGASVGTKMEMDLMDHFFLAFTQIARPVVGAALSTFMQIWGSDTNEKAGFQRNQTRLLGDILSGFGSAMVPGFQPGVNGGTWSNLITQFQETISPTPNPDLVKVTDIKAAMEILGKDGGEGEGGKGDGKGEEQSGDQTTTGASATSSTTNTDLTDIDTANMAADAIAANTMQETVETSEVSGNPEDLNVDEQAEGSESTPDVSADASTEAPRVADQPKPSPSGIASKESPTPENKPQVTDPAQRPATNATAPVTTDTDEPLEFAAPDISDTETGDLSSPETDEDDQRGMGSPAPDDRADNNMKVPDNAQVKVKDLQGKLPGSTIGEEKLKNGTSIERMDDDSLPADEGDVQSGGQGGDAAAGGGGAAGDDAADADPAAGEDAGKGVNVAPQTKLNAYATQQQLEAVSPESGLPAKWTPKEGSTAKGSMLTGDMLNKNPALKQTLELMKQDQVLQNVDANSSLRVDTFTNGDNNLVTAISAVSPDGTTQLLAVTESVGGQNITTTLRADESGLGATANIHAGDSKASVPRGKDIAVKDLDLTRGFDGEPGGLDKSAGAGGDRARGADDLKKGDRISGDPSSGDPAGGEPVDGPTVKTDGQVVKPGEGSEISLGAAGESTLEGGAGSSGPATTTKGKLANGGDVELSVDGAGNVQVNGDAAALENLLNGGTETVTLPDGQEATLKYDPNTNSVQVEGSSSALQSLSGNNNVPAGRNLDVTLPSGEEITLGIDAQGNVSASGNQKAMAELQANGGGKFDVTLPNGKSATLNVDAGGNVSLSGSMDALGGAMSEAPGTSPLANLADQEVTVTLPNGDKVTGKVTPDGNQVVFDDQAADAINKGRAPTTSP
ncbi:hypothetical protein JW933_06435, partial [candidate division FCPU426 bacterium]|nr:hypothetical protein [candidate division FCPU426 bacterium]